jgi:hypothetical protein
MIDQICEIWFCCSCLIFWVIYIIQSLRPRLCTINSLLLNNYLPLTTASLAWYPCSSSLGLAMETEHDYEHEAQAGGEMKEAGGTRFWWRWRERERERERRERG